MDRIPPSSEEAERGTLGSVLLDCSRVMDLCIEKGIESGAFYVPAHRTVWAAMLALHEASKAVDATTVATELRDRGELERIGSSVFLDRLIESTPTAAHSEYYIDNVMEKWTARRVIDANRQAEVALYEGGSTVEVVATHLHALTGLQGKTRGHDSKAEVWEKCKADALAAQQGKAIGLPTPWESFNQDTGGCVHAGVTLIVGGGGTRKSYLVNQIGLHAAVEMDIAGVYYPFEDGSQRSLARSVCMLAGVNSYLWARGKFTPEAENAMADAFKRLNKSPFDIRGGRGMSLSQRRLELARGVSKHGWKFCIFDAFKDMMRNPDDLTEQARTINWAADMAEEFDMPVLLTHHINAGNRTEQKKEDSEAERIKKRDIRGILTIWDAARMVLALQCQKKLTRQGRPVYTHYVLDGLKNNYGPLGACSLDINHGTGVFTSASRPPFSDWTTDEYETIEEGKDNDVF